MLELSRQRPIGVPALAHGRHLIDTHLVDTHGLYRADPAPSVQLIARDAFVAETAIKLDQVLLEIRSLARELQLVKSDMSDLRDDAASSYRFAEFLDREHKSRSVKLDDIYRKFDYLKARFDAIDGNSKGDFQSFRSFDAISRRLTELGSLERDFRQVAGRLKLSAAFFMASVLAWVAVLFLM